MGIARETAVAEAYCAELQGVEEAAHLIEENWDGAVSPAGELWKATSKLRRSERSVDPSKPEGIKGAELVPAGYDKTAQLYRWVWLHTPLTAEESEAVKTATRVLDRVVHS